MKRYAARVAAFAMAVIVCLSGVGVMTLDAGAATRCHVVAAHTVKRHWVKAHISHSSKGKIEHVRGHWVKAYVIKAHKVCYS